MSICVIVAVEHILSSMIYYCLQGRMSGNPYLSKEPGLGPLMRDVKNKICTDCELVALLEDDNGMELLVCFLCTSRAALVPNNKLLFNSSDFKLGSLPNGTLA